MHRVRMPSVVASAKNTGLMDNIPSLFVQKTKKRHGGKEHIVIDGLSDETNAEMYADGIVLRQGSSKYEYIQVDLHSHDFLLGFFLTSCATFVECCEPSTDCGIWCKGSCR